MTETEWLESTTPREQLRFFKGKVSERKLRLFAVAIHREYHHLDPRFGGPESDLAADTAEAFAEEERRSVYNFPRSSLDGYFVLNPWAYGAASSLADISDVPDAFKCSILRCIFGPLPLRSISISINTAWLAWHDGLIVSMARQMYDSRDFTDLPILADALEEAGCTNQEMLSHCRQQGAVHVRGCWVVDLLLGKE